MRLPTLSTTVKPSYHSASSSDAVGYFDCPCDMTSLGHWSGLTLWDPRSLCNDCQEEPGNTIGTGGKVTPSEANQPVQDRKGEGTARLFTFPYPPSTPPRHSDSMSSLETWALWNKLLYVTVKLGPAQPRHLITCFSPYADSQDRVGTTAF